jgi:iron(III) transport system ATP-binding protein
MASEVPSEMILQIQQVSKSFAQADHPAVNQVMLNLPSGEILGLLGPSGCGKTTLLRLIAGFEQPSAGAIILAGQSVASDRTIIPPEQRDIGMVFQDYALFPHLTVAQNIAFGLQQPKRKKFSPVQVKELTQSTIALVGLVGLADRYPHELSGGQQQRVALARAIAPQPALILLDEPLSNLDIQVRLYLRQEIRNILKTAQISAVFVTHDQEEAMSICDRIGVMNQGRLEQVDRPEDLYRFPKSRFVAEFVTQANFIPAQLEAAQWITEMGQFPAVEGSPAQTELMIRQEDMRLRSDDTSRLVIRDRQFLGREYRYWIITPEGRSIYAVMGLDNPLNVGDYVAVDVDQNAVQAL